jgi:hypothetical protein
VSAASVGACVSTYDHAPTVNSRRARHQRPPTSPSLAYSTTTSRRVQRCSHSRRAACWSCTSASVLTGSRRRIASASDWCLAISSRYLQVCCVCVHCGHVRVHPRALTRTTVLGTVTALLEFNGRHRHHLSFQKGELIHVVKEGELGWLEVRRWWLVCAGVHDVVMPAGCCYVGVHCAYGSVRTVRVDCVAHSHTHCDACVVTSRAGSPGATCLACCTHLRRHCTTAHRRRRCLVCRAR